MQKQKMKVEATIEIPETHVIIEKSEFEELKQQAGPEWETGLKWLSEQTGVSSPAWLKERILYPFRDELEGFVEYPEGLGKHWRFNVYYMKKWLRENFGRVEKG